MSTPEEVERYCREVVREFAGVIPDSYLATTDSFTLETGHPGARGEAEASGHIRSQARDRHVFIQVNPEELAGVSKSALQGWLEFEMVLSTYDYQAKPAWFNFKKQILPLVPASGSATYFMRELVEYLSTSLMNYRATHALIAMGRGRPQVSFRRFLMTACPDRYDNYAATLFHDWVRALILCKKARQYVALELLAESEVEAAQELRADWRERHNLLSEDQRLLSELSAILGTATGEDYSPQLVEMFLLVRDALLWRSEPQEVPGAVH